MAQFARPDSTIVATNFNNGFAEIDEATASDADYAWNTVNTVAELEVGLSDVDDPSSSSGHVFRYRIAKTNSVGSVDGAGNSLTVTARLMQGTTQIATDTAKTPDGTWTQYAYTLSGAEADAITDYAALRLEFVTTASGGSPANRRGAGISWAELEVPDAPIVDAVVSAEHVEVFVIPTDQQARVSSEYVEAFLVPTDQEARVSSVYLEVFVKPAIFPGLIQQLGQVFAPQVSTPAPSYYHQDLFGRTIAINGGWGGDWLHSASALLLGVDGNKAFYSNTGSTSKINWIDGAVLEQQDIRIIGDFTIADLPPSGETYLYAVLGRFIDVSNYYRLDMQLQPDGTIDLLFRKVISGLATQLGVTTFDVVTGLTGGEVLHFLVEFEGVSPTDMRLKVWKDGDTEPASFQKEVANSDSPLQASGSAGVRLLPSSAAYATTATLDNWEVGPLADPNVLTPGLISNPGILFNPSIAQQMRPGLVQQLGATFDPSVIFRIQPSLVQQLGVVHEPTFEQAILLQMGLIQQLGVALAPSLSPVILPGLISNPGTVFDPSINQQLRATLISQLGSTFAPSVAQQIRVGLIQQLGVIHSPQLGQQLRTGLISQLGAVFAPTRIYTDDIFPALIQQLGIVFAPSVSAGAAAQTVSPGLIQQLGVALAPEIAQQLRMGLISQLGTLFDPILHQSIRTGLINNLGQLFAPSLSQQIRMALLSNPGQVFAPDLIPTAAGQLNPQLIAQLGQVFSPSLAQQVQLGLIQQLGSTLAPTLLFNPRITPGLITQLGAVHNPSILQQIDLGLIPSTVLLFAPTVNMTVEVPLVALAPLVFAPEISVAQAVVSPDLISQLGQVFDPEIVGELLLLPTLIENLGVVFAPHILVGGQWVWIGQSGFGTTRDAGFPHMESGFGTTSRNEGDS